MLRSTILFIFLSYLGKTVFMRYTLITTATINVDVSSLYFYEDYGFLELASSISFLDFIIIIISVLVVRLFSWRFVILLYILYIWLQCKFLRHIYLDNIELPYNSFIEDILANLVIPFGSKLKTVIKKVHFSYAGGGGGLVISVKTNNPWHTEELLESTVSRFINKKQDSIFLKDYARYFCKNDFNNCIRLLKDEASLVDGKMALKHTHYFLKQLINEKRSFRPNNDFIYQFNEFSGIQFKTLLKKCEIETNTVYIFSEDKFFDLNSLDSSQREVSDKSDIFIFMVHYKKFEELVDISFFEKGAGTKKGFIFNLAEQKTRADQYSFLCYGKHESLIKEMTNNKARFSYTDVNNIALTFDASGAIRVIGNDITRKRIDNSSIEEVIARVYTEKLIPFKKVIDSVPHNQHNISIILTDMKDKAFCNNLEVGLNRKVLETLDNSKISVVIKTMIDPLNL